MNRRSFLTRSAFALALLLPWKRDSEAVVVEEADIGLTLNDGTELVGEEAWKYILEDEYVRPDRRAIITGIHA